MTEDARKDARFELDWNSRLKTMLSYNEGAVQIGITVLRTAVLLNGAAVIALLAFSAQLWKAMPGIASQVIGKSIWFAIGAFVGALGAAAAYFYQSFVAGLAEKSLRDISAKPDAPDKFTWLQPGRFYTAWAMVGLVTASYVMFAIGLCAVLNALSL